jgi:hypothetical protein
MAFMAYVNVGCYYIGGVPLGVFLGFYLDLGAKIIAENSLVIRWLKADNMGGGGGNTPRGDVEG